MSNAVVFPSGNATSATIAGRRFVTPVVRRNFPIPQVADEVKPRPLEVTLTRPPYIATDSLPTIDPDTQFLFWIYAGNVEGVDVGDSFTTYVAQRASGGSAITHRVYAVLSLSQSEAVDVSSVQVVVSQSRLAASSAWSAQLTRPNTVRLELARIVSRDGAQTVVGDAGNFTLNDVLVQVDATGGYVRKVVAMRV